MTTEEREKKAKALGAKYEVTIEDDNKVIYLKDPDKTVYKAWLDTFENDPYTASESVVRTLIVKEVSDVEVLEDYKALGAVFKQLKDIMALKKSSLKTL